MVCSWKEYLAWCRCIVTQLLRGDVPQHVGLWMGRIWTFVAGPIWPSDIPTTDLARSNVTEHTSSTAPTKFTSTMCNAKVFTVAVDAATVCTNTDVSEEMCHSGTSIRADIADATIFPTTNSTSTIFIATAVVLSQLLGMFDQIWILKDSEYTAHIEKIPMEYRFSQFMGLSSVVACVDQLSVGRRMFLYLFMKRRPYSINILTF